MISYLWILSCRYCASFAVFKSRKSICDKVLSETNCFTFEFWHWQEKWGMKCGWRSWVVEMKSCATLLTQNVSLPWTFRIVFVAEKSCYFQEIPLFGGSIYFTLPEIVMGPIWVPNASINTSWASLRVLIIASKILVSVEIIFCQLAFWLFLWAYFKITFCQLAFWLFLWACFKITLSLSKHSV